VKLSINPLESKSEVKRFKIPNKFVISHKGKRTNEISIVLPKICPICGKRDPDGKFKLKSTNRPRKYITILMCRVHKGFTEKVKNSKFLLLILISIIFFIISLLFLNLLINSIIFLIVLLAIPTICVFSTYEAIKRGYSLKFINEHINLKYYRTYSIISIKILEWANEFEDLNPLSEHISNLELIEELKNKRNRSLKNLGIVALIGISGMIISISLINLRIITIILYIVLLGAICLFLSMTCYYHTEIPEKKD